MEPTSTTWRAGGPPPTAASHTEQREPFMRLSGQRRSALPFDVQIIRTVILILLAGAACSGPADPELVERFRATCARLAADASSTGSPVIAGSDGWYFAATEVDALGLTGPRSDPVVAEIVSAAAELRRDGIELVVVPVPPKGVIYPDRLAPDIDVPIPVRRLDATLQGVYGDLQAQGVRVVDLTAAFLRDRFHHEGPLYCRQDSHWSGVGCVVAAEIIGAAVRDLAWFEVPPARPYGLAWFTTPIQGDLLQHLPQPQPREELRARGVIAPEDPLLAPVAPGGDRPVAVVGDTHVLVFHGGEPYHARGAGVADQLAFELKQPVALHADDVNASAAQAWDLSALGERTRVVVWILAATRLLAGA